MSVGERLQSLAASGRCILVPDVHDVLTAQLASHLGFEALYLGSFASAASRWGLPDQSLLSIERLIEHARIIASVVETPLQRTVRRDRPRRQDPRFRGLRSRLVTT